MINVVRGLTQRRAAALELMRSYAASERRPSCKVRVPDALPFFFTALKVGATLSLIGAIVGEYFGGSNLVLGRVIVESASFLRFGEAWAAIMIVVGDGHRLLSRHPRHRASGHAVARIGPRERPPRMAILRSGIRRKDMKHPWRISPVVTVLALLLAACGTGGTDTTPVGEPTASEPAASEPARQRAGGGRRLRRRGAGRHDSGRVPAPVGPAGAVRRLLRRQGPRASTRTPASM